ncbi:MAG: dipeptide ABC transporter ATP-binding protein [Alphaproteobacteria bacterium]|nr:dipeptide ABC transporter ATP-binding protein [Alphaproteobacteria bacterium]
MTQNLLSVEDLHVHFELPEGKIEAVRGVSFRVRPGSTVALVGESGSGKSVVSQAIMGILPKAAHIGSGRILYENAARSIDPVDIAALDPRSAAMRAIRGDHISIIFQEPMTSLSPLHTIGDQISEALHLHRDCSKPEGQALTEEILRLVGFPDPARSLRTYPFELSGGLRQRAMIAMALICRPGLLIADEPTTALDVTIQAQILKLIVDLQAELGMAVLIITHDLGVVANMADEIVVMYHGEVMESGTLDHIFHDAQHPYLKALQKAVPRFDMAPGERLIPIRAIEPARGFLHAAKEPWPETADQAGPMLKVENLRKEFTIRKGGWFGSGKGSRVAAVDDVSFEIKRGECLGLVGESGCGKTTLSKMLMRAISPDSGAVTYNDRGNLLDVLALGPDELIPFRRKLQFMFQDPYGSLNPRMTVFDIITEPLIIHNIGDAGTRRQYARELMELVGLDVRHLTRYPHSFSGGQRQRIGIARALALQPDMLICDEPVSALDVSVQAQILNLLKDLQAELGLTYLFISHNLAVVDYIADRIAVMCRGHLVETARSEDIFKNPVHPYTRALLQAIPEPNPDRPLDFSGIMEDRASDPAEWPQPFSGSEAERPVMRRVSDGHAVRALPGGDLGGWMS